MKVESPDGPSLRALYHRSLTVAAPFGAATVRERWYLPRIGRLHGRPASEQALRDLTKTDEKESLR